MKSFLMRTICCMCFAVPLSVYAEMPRDRTEQLLQAAGKQITTLRATYSFSPLGLPARTILVTLDFSNSNFDATKMYPPLKPGEKQDVLRCVYDGKETWCGSPADGQYAPPGSWTMEFFPKGLSTSRPDSKEEDYGIDLLRKAFVPYTVEHVGDQLPPGATISVEDVGDPMKGRAKRNYFIKQPGHKQPDWKLSYDLDLSDGVRIYSTVIYWNVSDTLIPVITLNCKDFQKSNGIWAPREIDYLLVNNQFRPYPPTHISFKRIELNPILSDDEFHFNPPEGSSIINMSNKDKIVVRHASEDLATSPSTRPQ